MDSPFLRPDSPVYADVLTDATVHVLGAKGIDRFSVRGIARWMRVVPSTVLGEFSRARVLELVCICFETRWLQWSGMESVWGPSPAEVPVRLPATEDEKLGVRVHNALLQLAEAERLRGNDAPKRHLDRLHQEELALLKLRMRSQCCSAVPPHEVVRAVLAFTSGLRHALSNDLPGMTQPEAVAVLADYIAVRSAHAPGCEDGQLAS
ncbi:MAG TPA: hypothetical protein VFV89_11275 [Nocardioides sp.]|uniref:hypothetical protein n=1 Tax=Nocardioides sp. TaxID=35761 RepID=UPI002E338D07|nr:hypothetical protein [Nocardioides sp.]HEX5088380.1 hypothetical protein [Nocardioides sp.]